MPEFNIPRIMIGADKSNAGKTMITCGILQCLVNRGIKTLSCKCGPDYIDPMFYRFITGQKARNLDSFFAREDMLADLLAEGAKGMELAVIEGVMGYYDGVGGVTDRASTYEIAGLTKSPAILIVDAQGMSHSAAALVKGFLEYRQDSHIRGIILNRVSPMLYPRMKELLEGSFKVKVLGYLPKLEDFRLESIYLGLLNPVEMTGFKEMLERLSKEMEKSLDFDAILQLARSAGPLSYHKPEIPRLEEETVIGVARDEAFTFFYEENMELLKRMGAKIRYFSPLRDKKLPEDICGLWLGGGYPERYARELSQNRSMRESIRRAVLGKMPCVAECGGFLYLHQELEDVRGDFYEEAGVIEARAYRTGRLQRFGYIWLKAGEDSLMGKKDEGIPAHEFHYWESENPGKGFTASKPAGDRTYPCIHTGETLYAGFPHLYLPGCVSGAFRYLLACREFQNKIR